MAAVATREFRKNANIAACYTFGSPKVGNSEFGDSINVPIYRIVNAADMVPRTPPTFILEGLIALARITPLPWFKSTLVGFLTKHRGYTHYGDMRYLTACNPDLTDLRVVPNLNVILRTARLFRRLIATSLKAGAGDHRISEYCKKLRSHAKSRLHSQIRPSDQKKLMKRDSLNSEDVSDLLDNVA